MKKTPQSTRSEYATASKSYRAFLATILRQKSKPEKPADLVNLYLDCFLTFTRKMNGPTVIAAGLCKEGKFTEWRKEQKRAGNLDWDTAFESGKPITPDYRIGPKISKYIQLVAEENGLIATKGYIDYKIQKLEEKFANLENAFDKLIIFLDPPVTAQKRVYYQANPQLLFMSTGPQKMLKKIVEDFEENNPEDNDGEHPDYSRALKN